jgi:hypothetical protein
MHPSGGARKAFFLNDRKERLQLKEIHHHLSPEQFLSYHPPPGSVRENLIKSHLLMVME